MSKKPFDKRLPTLARKGFSEAKPNQYIGFYPEMQKKLASKDLLQAAITLILQLKPDQKIQYVTLEQLEYREVFLEIGLIKPTKKVGADRYVVPKTAACCGVEQPHA